MRIRFLSCAPDLARGASKLESHLGSDGQSYSGSTQRGSARGSGSSANESHAEHSGAQATAPKPYGWIVGKLRGKRIVAAKSITASRITMPVGPSLILSLIWTRRPLLCFRILSNMFLSNLVSPNLAGATYSAAPALGSDGQARFALSW